MTSPIAPKIMSPIHAAARQRAVVPERLARTHDRVVEDRDRDRQAEAERRALHAQRVASEPPIITTIRQISGNASFMCRSTR